MEYLPGIEYQVNVFLYSAGLGFALGAVNDILKIIFIIFTGNDKKLLMVRDILYLLICLFATFIFLLVMCFGEILMYVFVGELIGFFMYYYSISLTFTEKLSAISIKIYRATYKIKCKIRRIFCKICEKIKKIIYFPKIKQKICKKDLHNGHNLVYNSFVKLYHSVNLF